MCPVRDRARALNLNLYYTEVYMTESDNYNVMPFLSAPRRGLGAGCL